MTTSATTQPPRRVAGTVRALVGRFCDTCGHFGLCSSRGLPCPWMGCDKPGSCQMWYPIKRRRRAANIPLCVNKEGG
jgi:hypothetical protein